MTKWFAYIFFLIRCLYAKMNKTSYITYFEESGNNLNYISPIEPFYLYLLGSFLTLTLILGTSLNGGLLFIFKKNRDLRTPLNALIIAITVLNLIGCITGLPLVIHSCFSSRFILKIN